MVKYLFGLLAWYLLINGKLPQYLSLATSHPAQPSKP